MNAAFLGRLAFIFPSTITRISKLGNEHNLIKRELFILRKCRHHGTDKLARQFVNRLVGKRYFWR